MCLWIIIRGIEKSFRRTEKFDIKDRMEDMDFTKIKKELSDSLDKLENISFDTDQKICDADELAAELRELAAELREERNKTEDAINTLLVTINKEESNK